MGLQIRPHVPRIIKSLGLLFIALPLSVSGEITTGELEIKAGLNEAMSVVCDTPLNFGVTSIRSGNRGNATTIALDRRNNDLTPGGNKDNISTGQGTAGECSLYGSGASDGSTVTVTFENAGADVELSADEGAGNAPGQAKSGITVGDFTVTAEPDLTQNDNGLEDGDAPFTVGGTLTIPGNLPRNTIGDYRATVTVTVEDEI